MKERRLQIKSALESMMDAQRHRDFQRLAVQLAKAKWTELEATHEQDDGGEDATSFFVGKDGVKRCLACSLTGTLNKIKQDARRIKERGGKIDALVFMTPVPVTNLTIPDWRKAIREEFGHDLHVIPRPELIALLEQPQSAWLCHDYLHLLFEDEPPHAKLVAVSDKECRQLQQMLLAYKARLEAILSHGLPPELPQLTQSLPQAEHFALLGPSGIGKTVRLRRYALESVNRSALVFFVEAMHYNGEFRDLIQRSVAPFFAGKIEELRHAASACRAPIVLVVDGFDRCKESLVPSLVRDINALYELCNCRVVIGSKFDPDFPPTIKGRVVQMSHLTLDQKLAVFRFHADDSDFSDASLLEPFETAHDLMVAGKCRSKLSPDATRTELYDTYVAQCLPASHPTVAGALCRHLAAVLSREFASAMNCHDFEKEAESFVSRSGATLQVVDEVRQTGLVRVSPVGFSFRHELIQEHLYADWLCRALEDLDALVSELQKPAHRQLADAVLSRQKSPDKAQKILQAVPGTELFAKVFHGGCGPIARQVLLHDCHAFLSLAAADSANVAVRLDVVTEDGNKRTFAAPVLERCQNWSEYATCLAEFVGRHVDHPEFAERVADLLAVYGASFQQAIETAVESAGGSKRAALDDILHQCLVLHGGSQQCPAAVIFHAWRNSWRTKKDPNGPWAKALWSRSSNTSIGAQAFILFALCELYARAEAPSVEALERAFRLAWDSRLGWPRTQALEMLENVARGDVAGSIRDSETIRSLLRMVDDETRPKRDIITNTLIIDAMNAYGMVPAPVQLESAVAEIRGVLNPESEHARKIMEVYESQPLYASCDPLAETAYRIVGLFFEEVFQGVYLEAFHSLSEGEQTSFLNLAAQAKDPFFHLAYILAYLFKACSPSSLPIFHRFAARIQFDSPFPQEAVRGFLLAVAGCAKLNAELPPWQMEQNPATEAWRMIRQIVYEHSKGSSELKSVQEPWLSLRAEALLGAADALFNVKRSFEFAPERADLSVDLAEIFPQNVKVVMEHSLLSLAKLTSGWKFGAFPNHVKERADFVISVLGRLGDRNTAAALKRFIGDPALGQGAIAAIKAIKAREDHI